MQSSSGGAGSSQGGSLFQDEVKVVPDKATNALVIYATSKDFLVLRDVVRRLDVPRRQVFIEATVMIAVLTRKNWLVRAVGKWEILTRPSASGAM